MKKLEKLKNFKFMKSNRRKMMLKEKLLEDLKNAMKEKNEIKKNTVQMVRAAILQIEKDKAVTLEDDQILDIIAKESKKRKDSLEDYKKGGREDIVAQVEEEIAVLSCYLPKQLTKEELIPMIQKMIEEVGATSMKDMGIVMKEAKQKIGTAADGKTINEIVKQILS